MQPERNGPARYYGPNHGPEWHAHLSGKTSFELDRWREACVKKAQVDGYLATPFSRTMAERAEAIQKELDRRADSTAKEAERWKEQERFASKKACSVVPMPYPVPRFVPSSDLLPPPKKRPRTEDDDIEKWSKERARNQASLNDLADICEADTEEQPTPGTSPSDLKFTVKLD